MRGRKKLTAAMVSSKCASQSSSAWPDQCYSTTRWPAWLTRRRTARQDEEDVVREADHGDEVGDQVERADTAYAIAATSEHLVEPGPLGGPRGGPRAGAGSAGSRRRPRSSVRRAPVRGRRSGARGHFFAGSGAAGGGRAGGGAGGTFRSAVTRAAASKASLAADFPSAATRRQHVHRLFNRPIVSAIVDA